MKLRSLLLFFFTLGISFALTAQTDADKKMAETKAAAEKAEMGWKKGGALGLDLAGLGLINPRLGAGDNRLGFGGLVSLFAKRKMNNSYWDNNAALQLSAQRIGGSDAIFQKNLDMLRLNSRYGYNILKDKLFFALDADASTQLLPTYVGNVIDGPSGDLLSQFLAPARLTISPGIDFKPTAKTSFFLSPVSMNLIYVGNDSLAILPGQPLGNEEGKNNRLQLGYMLKGKYANKIFKDRIAFGSQLGWFADYRQNLNGNVLWQNTVDITIFKGLSLNLFGDLFYDHFSKAIIKDVPEGTAANDLDPYLGLTSSYTGGFLLKYARIF